jgi:hypothetical protein
LSTKEAIKSMDDEYDNFPRQILIYILTAGFLSSCLWYFKGLTGFVSESFNFWSTTTGFIVTLVILVFYYHHLKNNAPSK